MSGEMGLSTASGASCAVIPSPCRTVTLSSVLGRFDQEAHQNSFNTGRYRCPYFSWGAGPPIVFIPGLADNSRSFILPAAGLTEHFQCIAYDLPTGHGDGAPLRRYTHDDLVADLFDLIDHLSLPRCYLFGSSFGGTVALAALHARPERFPRAILQGAFACRRLAPAEVLLARLARFWPGSMRHMPFHNRVLRRNHSLAFAEKSPELWGHFFHHIGSAPMAAVAHHALLLHAVDLRSKLPEIRQPILLVCGDDDPLVGKDCEEVLLDGLPNAARVELSRCGHFPMFSHAEELAGVIRQFLTPHGETTCPFA